MDKLHGVQSRVAEPLVLYWSVRVRLRGRIGKEGGGYEGGKVDEGQPGPQRTQQLDRGQASGGPVPCDRAPRLVLVSEGQVERTDGWDRNVRE